MSEFKLEIFQRIKNKINHLILSFIYIYILVIIQKNIFCEKKVKKLKNNNFSCFIQIAVYIASVSLI